MAVPSAAEGARAAAMVEAAAKDDWANLAALSASSTDDAARDLAQWLRLREGEPGFAELAAFLARNPAWPGTDGMRRDAERLMPPGTPAKQVLAFFDGATPNTGSGALLLARALRATGKPAEAKAEAIRAWTTYSMTPSDEAGYLESFGKDLAPHHRARLDMLLWRGLGGEAERQAARLPAGDRALARARTALRDGDKGVDGLIKQIPAALQDDAGLAYERFRWRDRKGLDDSAVALMRERSPNRLGRAELWADRRAAFARQAQRDGNYALAYELASRHGLTEGSDYADLEWLSGWIALRFLGKPDAALKHFGHLAQAVETPISLGRAGYWQGRALEALGRKSDAQAAYARGALHQTSFYGQLASEKLGGAPDRALSSPYPAPAMPEQEFGPPRLLRAALLLHAGGEERLSRWFFLALAENVKGETQYAALAATALQIGRPEIAVRTAKTAARDGGLLTAAYYPLTDLAQVKGPVPTALALSIARQESEMNPRAISPAGARGLMQLMPGTAKLVADKLGEPYGYQRLTDDWRYNARLGQEYLSWLVDEFGALPLVAAGYNAGPQRVRSWLARYGDPRGKGTETMVDWLETIPFNETRNYAQRVMEGLHVYEVRLSGEPKPVRLAARLGG